MKIRAARQNSSGFTLIELIVSGALMAVILASAYVCLNSSILSQKLVESRVEAVQGARVAMAMMTADLRSACLLTKEFEFLGLRRMLGEVEADNLDFATHHYTPARPRESDFCEVSYFLAEQPGSKNLSLWRRRDPTPDLEPLSGGSREEIARNVRGLRFEYYDGFDWYEEWGDPDGHRKGRETWRAPANLYGLPEAVRITLWLDPGSRSQGKDAPEPALAFQTVARLNLAAISYSSGSSGSASNAVDEAASQPTPNGGNP